MDRVKVLIRRHGFDVLIVLAAVLGGVEFALRSGSRVSQTPLWLAALAVALVVLPLLARRRFPFAAPASVWLVAAALSFVDGQLMVFTASIFVAGMAAALLLGNLADPIQARVGLAVVVGGAVIVVSNDPNRSPDEFIFITVLFVIAWLTGFAMRRRAAQADAAEERALQAERTREAGARIAVAEERARIARELHDVVAHAVSVMVLQVGAVRHGLPPGLDEDGDALQRVEQAGRTALAEMRRLLGAMGRGEDGLPLAPQPSLDDLDALLDAVGRAGLPVRLHVDGDPGPLPRGVDLSAYRIVQEGLTNALKHAHANQADVSIHYGPDELRIAVSDDGRGGSASDGVGHGLVGVRERVKIYGGEMTADARPQGGFVLLARLPFGGDG